MRAVLLILVLVAACAKGDEPPAPTSGAPNARPETGPKKPRTGSGAPQIDERALARFGWTIARDGRELLLFGQERKRRFELDSEDTDLGFVGPDVLIEVARTAGRTRVSLRETPMFETTAKLELDLAVSLRAMTGPRLALVAEDMQHVAV